MGGAMTIFSIRASITTPGNYDRTTVAVGKWGAYTVSRALKTETERAFCAPLAPRVVSTGTSRMGLRDRGITLSSRPLTPLTARNFSPRGADSVEPGARKND